MSINPCIRLAYAAALLVLVALIPVVITSGSSTAHAAPLATSTGEYCADAEEAGFLVLINAHRAGQGVPPLVLSQALGAAAFHYSDDMATNNYIGGATHRRLDGSNSLQNMQSHGYTPTGWYNVAENLAYGTETAVEAFAEWKGSTKGHNETMLNPL